MSQSEINAPPTDLRAQFSETLNEIQAGLVEIGSLVTENLHRAGEAMREGRLDLIPDVRQADTEIDRRVTELELRTFETLARQGPVARDLRFLIATTRILYEQERSGDLVVNCINMLEREEGFPDLPNIQALIDRVVAASAGLFAASVDAIADLDETAGPRLDAADDEVDQNVSRLYTEIGQEAEAMGLETAIAMSRVGRFLERIADHAVNIGENITYVATSQLPDTHMTPTDEV